MSDLTDFELNKAILVLVYPIPNTRGIEQHRDYCNSWNDLMPLVVKHGITIYTTTLPENYQAASSANPFNVSWLPSQIHCNNTNPQRALAECLLLVLQAKANE